MFTHKSLLEAYVYAKDKCCPSLVHEIYEPDAVLSISTSENAVAFPPKVVGADGIAQTLVTDFSRRFTQCRTYYVCDRLAPEEDRIDRLPWLVLMREEDSASLRIGRGYYDWKFNRHGRDAWRAREMHISIDHMVLVADIAGDLLQTVQSFLPYPWLPPKVLDSSFGFIGESNPSFAFLKEFRSDTFGVRHGRMVSAA
ncbi:hypothetical protein [Herbaspirillum sp.]|uniref:hypothetical protein n=1 Tax=Herbaspirillum sp. TaxID=1890675 RepID=UPI0031D18F5E